MGDRAVLSICIYADFNDQDENGRVWLHAGASLRDIEQQEEHLYSGMPIILYTDAEDYVEVAATLLYATEHQVWLAVWGDVTEMQADAAAELHPVSCAHSVNF